MRIARCDSGQALVETAFSLTLFIVMILGAVEFGRMTYAGIQVGNAAKAAAQYASQSPATATDYTGIQSAAKAEYDTPASLTLVSPTKSADYTCTCPGSNTSVSCTNNSITSPTCTGGAAVEVTVNVQTRVAYTPTIHLPGVPGTFNLNGFAKQKVLQ